ncbi:MAG: DUF294 nucleotidyltransferase-like domain-containing protein [Venatoribacter sp.]
MSIQINLNQPPFSFLEAAQLERLTQKLDLVFYPKGELILKAGEPSPGLFIVYKGLVEEINQADTKVYSQYGKEDIFDVRALLQSTSKHSYRAVEETLCYLLPAKDFIELLEGSSDFSIYFQTDLGSQQGLLEKRETEGVSEFILSRIDQSSMRPAVYVAGQTSLGRVASLMDEKKYDALLVRTAKDVGIVTGTDLLRATLLGDKNKQTRVAEIAQFNLVQVELGDFLFNALLKMIQHNIERVIVTHQGDVVGMLELMDMLSLFSTHSHVIAIRIEQAKSLKELVLAAQRLDELIRSLHHQGVKVTAIMELITTLNRRLIQRAFELIFPERLRNSLCVLVLGSEGRGEQILKTDQDNAIILANEHDREAVQPLLQSLHQVLLDFGYPRCPGGVMFINESWMHTVEEWQEKVARWLSTPAPEAMMNMAIFMDAVPVCGNADLLKPIKASWQQAGLRASLASAWFARPALQFETPLSFLGNIRENDGTIDIKKGGIFPIVHGVRALAFEYGVSDTNTFARIGKLQELQVFDEERAHALKDALLFFLRIRLKQQLQADQLNPGLSQQLQLNKLRSVDRNMLRHALHRVKKFKQFLHAHYHLENFG